MPQLRPVDVLIDAVALRKLLDGPEPPAVLDVRWALGDPDGRAHFLGRHIPGAVYADLDTELAGPPTAGGGRHPLPEPAALQAAARAWGLRAGQPVVVYDDNGGLAAGRAWWLLRWAGVPDVRILDGALAAWTEAGFELRSGDHQPDPGDVSLDGGHLPVLTADEAAALARDGVLLDARAGERYRGETEPVDLAGGAHPRRAQRPHGRQPDRRRQLRRRRRAAGPVRRARRRSRDRGRGVLRLRRDRGARHRRAPHRRHRRRPLPRLVVGLVGRPGAPGRDRDRAPLSPARDGR